MVRRLVVGLQIVVGSGVLIAVLAIFVFPTTTFLQQRGEIDEAQHQLDVLQAENERLTERTKDLKDLDEVERVAREKYGMVMPGEEAYAIVAEEPEQDSDAATAPAPVVTTTTTKPSG